jgi:putative ABC transport system ATP-binding protein
MGEDVAVAADPAVDPADGPADDAGSFTFEDVVIERGGRRVLGPFDLRLPTHGPIAVAGPSGSGKSSLLRLLNRLDAPGAGQIRLRGVPLEEIEPTALRRRVAMVFQAPVVLPGTVRDNLLAASPTLDDAGIAAALDEVGLASELAEREGRDLSGGEAQRMCLARSLATDPEVVLFDEPTSSLDEQSAAVIERLALQLEERGILTIWVTHAPEQLERLARHVVRLDGTAVRSEAR